MILAVERSFVGLAAVGNPDSTRCALIGSQSTGLCSIIDCVHPPLSRECVRAGRSLAYSCESGFPDDGFCLYRVRKLLGHGPIIGGDRFDTLERGLSIFLHREFDRMVV